MLVEYYELTFMLIVLYYCSNTLVNYVQDAKYRSIASVVRFYHTEIVNRVYLKILNGVHSSRNPSLYMLDSDWQKWNLMQDPMFCICLNQRWAYKYTSITHVVLYLFTTFLQLHINTTRVTLMDSYSSN